MHMILIRTLLGTDMALGVLSLGVLCITFEEEMTLTAVAVAVVGAHLPDLDMIPFLLLRKKCNLHSHWPLGHHPLLLIPLGFLGGYLTAVLSGEPRMFLSSLGGLTVFLHFLHDSMQTDGLRGLPWLSPFHWDRYHLRLGWPERVPEREVLRFYAGLRGKSRKKDSSTYELAWRARLPGRKEAAVWTAAITTILVLSFL